MEMVIITLENGETIEVTNFPDSFWGWMNNDAWGDPAPEEGAAASIALVGEDGEPAFIAPDRVNEIDARLDTDDWTLVLADLRSGMYGDITRPDDTSGPSGDTPAPSTSGSSDDGGCGSAGDQGVLWSTFAALLALVWIRRTATQ